LRPEHLVEIGGARLNGTQAEPQREQGETGTGKPARADPVFQDRGDGGGDELRDPGHQHDGADLEGIVTTHEGEKDRHQIDRAEQTDAKAKAQGAADRKGTSLQRGKPHHRMRCTQAAMNKNAETDRASRQQDYAGW
jgi:hypothetical protein